MTSIDNITNDIKGLDSSFERPSYIGNVKEDTMLDYRLILSIRYAEDRYGGSYNIPEHEIHKSISISLSEYLLEQGHINFRRDKDIITGNVITTGSINIFDMNKFNKRYRPEYLV